MYPDEKKDRYVMHMIETMSGLLSFVNLVVPFLAAGIASDLCFHSYLFRRDSVTVDTTYVTCILPYTINGIPVPGECAEYSEFGEILNFQPTFHYTYQVDQTLHFLLSYTPSPPLLTSFTPFLIILRYHNY